MTPTGSKTVRIDLLSAPDPNTAADHARRKTDPAPVPPPADLSEALQGSCKTLFQALYDAALITGRDGTILAANERAVAFFKTSIEQLTGSNCVEWFYGADYSLLSTIQNHLENHRFIVLKALGECTDGSYFPSEIAVSTLTLNGTNALLLSIRNISNREKSAQAKRWMEFIINQSNTITFMTDQQQSQMPFMSECIRYYGYEPDEFTSSQLQLADILHPQEKDEILLWLSQCTSDDQEQFHCECQIRDRLGYYHPMQLNVWSFPCDEDKPNCLIGVLSDLIDNQPHKTVADAPQNAAQAPGKEAISAQTYTAMLNNMNRNLAGARAKIQTLTEIQHLIDQTQTEIQSLIRISTNDT